MQAIDISLSKSLTGHQNPIFAVEGRLDTLTFFTAGNDKGIVEWDLQEGKFKRILCAVPASVYALHMIPDSTLLAVGMRNGEVWLVDVLTQSLANKFKVDKGAVFAVQSIPSKQELIAIGEEGVAYVWSLENHALLYRFRVSDTTVRTMALYPQQQQIVFGDKQGQLYLHAVDDFQQMLHKSLHSLPVTALLATDTAIYSGGRDAQLYQLEKKDLVPARQVTPHMFTVYGILQHPIYPILITVSRDKSIKIWEKDNLALLKNISLEKGYDCHRLSINAACIHPVSKQLITVSDDKVVKVWDVFEV